MEDIKLTSTTYYLNNESRLNTVSMLLAYDKFTYGIGKDNKLCWKIKEDLSFFKNYTTDNSLKDKYLIFGRKTYENLPKNIFNNRNIFILTKNEELYNKKNEYDNNIKHIYISFDDLLKLINKKDSNQTRSKEYIVCGGKEIYKKFLLYGLVDYAILNEISFNENIYSYDTFIEREVNYIKEKSIYNKSEILI